MYGVKLLWNWGWGFKGGTCGGLGEFLHLFEVFILYVVMGLVGVSGG